MTNQTDQADQDVVLVEQIGAARVLTFNRPEALNAMGGGLPGRILEELDRADADDEARVVILTGAGRGFCAGGDVKAMYRSRVQGADDGAAAAPRAFLASAVFSQGAIPQKIRKLSKPVIGAINGDAAGAGCDIALSVDIRIASERARFGEVFGRMGLIPDNGGLYLLPRLVGMARAAEMILTAEMFTVDQIADWGLLNAVVPHDELMPAALEFAERIANTPPLALATAKWGLQRAQHADFETSFDWVNYSMNLLRASPEHKEAVARFVEERAARRASSD
jgi:2-(1,2-epoxy-1,2-dihydrophenyl)acetyl-CoA isomerase